MDASAVRQVRSFNRMVAEGMGAVTDQFLGRGRPMGESRVLWEIGTSGCQVRALRTRLGLDSGYASRVLQSLARQGLVTVVRSPNDARAREARLTRAGRVEWATLDRRSDNVAETTLEPLAEKQRARLLAAMAEVERLLRASMVRFAVEDPTSSDAGWCIAQYFAELDSRFDAGFDPSRSISADAKELTPPAGALLIARFRDRPVGCGAVKFHAGAPAELKRMWVSREMRGLGLGERLLTELERLCRESGVRTVHLETNRSLKEAIDLYRKSGYVEVAAFNQEPYAHHWFEKEL